MPHEEAFDHGSQVPAVTPTIPARQLRAAALTVARNAHDATDCARLLAMLGLLPQDALEEEVQA